MGEKYTAVNRTELLETAQELFFEHGLENISVADVYDLKGKGAEMFYAFFDDKLALVLALLEHLMDNAYKEYERCLTTCEPFSECVKQLVQLQYDFMQSNTFALIQDIGEIREERINDLIIEKNGERSSLIVHHFAQAQARGEIRADINLDFIGFVFFEVKELMKNPYLLAMYAKPEDLWMEVIKYHFYGIAGKVE